MIRWFSLLCFGSFLKVSTDIHGKNSWVTCFEVNGVKLPTGYYFGASAATGELAGHFSKINTVKINIILLLNMILCILRSLSTYILWKLKTESVCKILLLSKFGSSGCYYLNFDIYVEIYSNYFLDNHDIISMKLYDIGISHEVCWFAIL